MKNKKTFFTCILALLISSNVFAVSTALWIQALRDETVKFTYNGVRQEFFDPATGEKLTPIIYNDRTYLPVRAIAEFLSLEVTWDETTNTISLYEPDIISMPTEPVESRVVNIAIPQDKERTTIRVVVDGVAIHNQQHQKEEISFDVAIRGIDEVRVDIYYDDVLVLAQNIKL